MAVQSTAFAECLTEQLVKRILEWNGYGHLPTPIVSFIPVPQGDADPAPVLTALSAAKKDGLLEGVKIPTTVLEDTIKRMVATFGVTWPDELEVPDEDMPEKAPEKPVDEANSQAVSEAVDKVQPMVLAGIRGVLLDSDGSWRPDVQYDGHLRLGTARKRVFDVLKTGGSILRKPVVDLMASRGSANTASQDVYLVLQSYYGKMESDIYGALREAIAAECSVADSMALIESRLYKSFGRSGKSMLIQSAVEASQGWPTILGKE